MDAVKLKILPFNLLLVYSLAAKLMFELAVRLRSEIQTRSLLQHRCNVLSSIYQAMQIAELCEEVITIDLDSVDI